MYWKRVRFKRKGGVAVLPITSPRRYSRYLLAPPCPALPLHDSGISVLSGLRDIDLTYNPLTDAAALPPEMCGCTRLVRLDAQVR